MSARRIDGLANVLPIEQQNFPAQPSHDTPSNLPQSEDVIAASDRLLPDFRVEMRRFALQQQVAPTTGQTGSAVNNLRAGEAIPVRIEANDTQPDVLRRAYTQYAQRAGLTSSGQARFVEQMMRTGGETINHAGTNQPFTDEEFAARRAQGTISMVPSEGQVAYLRQLKVEELLSYGVFDWAVTEGEERQVVEILRNDPDISRTIRSLNDSNYLGALIDRVDETENRRELITLLGSRLDAETARLVEPHIENIDNTMIADPGAVAPSEQVNTNVWQVRFNLARMGVTQVAPPFDRAAYQDLVSSNMSAPFTGVGAKGVNPTTLGVPWLHQPPLLIEKKLIEGEQFYERMYGNPVGGLQPYLDRLTATERQRQVELLVRQPISTTMPELYAEQPPSRADVIRAAAQRYNLEPELVTAFILAEARDQSQREDAAEYSATVNPLLNYNGSIGLGQVQISTARNFDLFADLISERTRNNLSRPDVARMLASDEVNIFATARYIRHIADMGASPELRAREAARGVFTRPPVQDLSQTTEDVPGIDLNAYARHSSEWPEANVRALGSEYTSNPWDNSIRAWGGFVLEAYRDVKASGEFRR